MIYPWRSLTDIHTEAANAAQAIINRQSLWRIRKSRPRRWWLVLLGREPLEFVIDPKTGDIRHRRRFE